jgi:hypothetical protein
MAPNPADPSAATTAGDDTGSAIIVTGTRARGITRPKAHADQGS